MTRAKFKCQSVTNTEEGSRVLLEPVISGSEENDKFFKYTPYGGIEIGTINKDAVFKPGKEYYVDFSEA